MQPLALALQLARAPRPHTDTEKNSRGRGRGLAAKAARAHLQPGGMHWHPAIDDDNEVGWGGPARLRLADAASG